MVPIPYPRWPKGCLYEHAPYFKLHWPTVQGKQWSLSPALNVLAVLGPIARELEGTWRIGTRINRGYGKWWSYYLTRWENPWSFDRLQITFYCIPEVDHVIMRVSARLTDENEVHILSGFTDYEYLGETTKDAMPWTQPTHIVLRHVWGTISGELTISPVWPPNRWPKIPEKQL